MSYKQNSPQSVAEGGTGASTLTDHAVLIGSGTGAVSLIGPVASTGALLASNGVGSDPGFTTATYPLTTTANELLYSSATNTVGGLTTANNSVVLTNGSGVPSLGTSLDNDFTFTSATAAVDRTLNVTNTDTTAANYSAANVNIVTQSATTGDPYLHLDVTSGQDYAFGIDNSDSDALKITDDADPSTGNVLWKMSSSGERTMPLQPCFCAYVSSTITNVTGDGTVYIIIFDTEDLDAGGDYDVSNGRFTAPVAGNYLFNATVVMNGITSSHTTFSSELIRSAPALASRISQGDAFSMATAGNVCTVAGSWVVSMTAGQTMRCTLTVTGGTKVVGVAGSSVGYTTFSGCLLS